MSTFILNASAAIGLSCVSALCAPGARATLHEQHPGSGVTAHYVRLTGWGGDKAVEHKRQVDMRADCASRNAVTGQPVQPLPPGGIPEVVKQIEMEFYYTANRTLHVMKAKRHQIDVVDCGLRVWETHTRSLISQVGRCDIDLIKGEAVGHCRAEAHARAPAEAADASAQRIDWSKVPPHMRAAVQAMREQGAKAAAQPTGQTGSYAGVRCEVYRHEALDDESCLARPPSTAGSGRVPSTMSTVPFHGGQPGVLLSTKSPKVIDLQAQVVQFDLPVSDAVFGIPAGVKARENPLSSLVPVPR